MTHVLRNLRRILRKHKEKWKTDEELLARINEARQKLHTPVNGDEEFEPLTRHKLRSILGTNGDQESVNLFDREIQILHDYLISSGEGGFASLMVSPTLLRSVADTGKVALLVPSKSLQGSTAVIQWDLHAMNRVFEALKEIDGTIEFRVEDVLLPDVSQSAARRTDWKARSAGERWFRRAMGEDRPSVICIASPRASLAAELMLAEMYRVAPFDPSASAEDVPFRFFYKPASRVPSCFTARKVEVKRDVANSRTIFARPKLSAIVLREGIDGKGCFLIDRDPSSSSWESFGFIAAQRREGGEVWVVLGGLEGPGTLAAACALLALKETVPLTFDPAPSKILQYLVRCNVSSQTVGNGTEEETRTLDESSVKYQEIPG